MSSFYAHNDQDDTFLGGSGDDQFYFTVSQLTAGDIVRGEGGYDTFVINRDSQSTTITASQLSGVSGMEYMLLDILQSFTVTITDAFVVANPNLEIGSGGDITIDASSTTHGVTYSPTIYYSSFGPGGVADITAGSGDDTFRLSAEQLGAEDHIRGGAGYDRLVISRVAPWGNANLGGVSGIEEVRLVGTSFGGASVTVTDLALSNNAAMLPIYGSGYGDTIDASSVTDATHGINVRPGDGNDVVRGGAGRDWFNFDADQLDSGDVVMGNGGDDTIFIRAPGTITAADLAHVNGIETVRLLAGGVSLALDDLSASKNAPVLQVYGSDGDDTVDASAVTLMWRGINVAAGAGDDVLKGGAGIDSFHIAVADLDAGDVIHGGGGYDMLYLAGGGTVTAADLSGVASIEKIQLLAGTTLVLDSYTLEANPSGAFGPDLDIFGSAGDDTIDASAATSTSHGIRVDAGAGDDAIRTGSGGGTIFGGAGFDGIVLGTGDDILAWTGTGDLVGTDQITGFDPGSDLIQLAASAFHVNGAALDTAADGDFGTTLAGVDLFRSSAAVADAGDLLARLLTNATGDAGEGLLVLAPDVESGRDVLYYVTDASGHGSAYALAAFALDPTEPRIGLADIVLA